MRRLPLSLKILPAAFSDFLESLPWEGRNFLGLRESTCCSRFCYQLPVPALFLGPRTPIGKYLPSTYCAWNEIPGQSEHLWEWKQSTSAWKNSMEVEVAHWHLLKVPHFTSLLHQYAPNTPLFPPTCFLFFCTTMIVVSLCFCSLRVCLAHSSRLSLNFSSLGTVLFLGTCGAQ